MTDQQFQEQLLLAELPTPIGAWDKLFAVLEEDADDTTKQNELNYSSLKPPRSVWTAIEQELNVWKEDEVFAATINQNSITPPAPLWNSIESLLNAADDKELAATLNTAAVKAPVTAWANIEHGLHPQAKVVSITKRYLPFYKMAAAAAIIAFISWGVFQMMPKKTTQVAVTEMKPTQEKVSTPSDTNTTLTQPVIALTELKPNLPKQENNLVASYKPQQTRKRNATEEVMQHEKPTTKQTDFSETNYLLVLNDEGDLIRVSKKLSTMDCAQNGAVPVDAITALQGKDCDARIKKIQQKMATSIMGSILDPLALTNSTDK